MSRFSYTCPAIVLHRDIDRTQFHLIYATRNPEGVQVFKEVEKKAMKDMETARANAQQRKRKKKTGQNELFSGRVRYRSTRYDRLRERYSTRAMAQVQETIHSKKRVLYDDVWIEALSFPLVWESDLKTWIADWVRQGHMRIEGMKPRQRVPKRQENNFLVWAAPSPPKSTGTR